MQRNIKLNYLMFIREKQSLPVYEIYFFNLFVLEHQVEACKVRARMELPMGPAIMETGGKGTI